MNQTEWQIKSSAHACSSCRKEFTDGEAFTSSLVTDPDTGFMRVDTCTDCWRGIPQIPAISRWKTSYRAPAPRPEEAIRKETAEVLLRRLVESGEETHRGVVFVLAVMLERRRLLVERDVQRTPEGGRLRIYEHRGTGETFLIFDPELHLHDLEIVQQEVMTLLGGPDGAPAGISGEMQASEPS